MVYYRLHTTTTVNTRKLPAILFFTLLHRSNRLRSSSLNRVLNTRLSVLNLQGSTKRSRPMSTTSVHTTCSSEESPFPEEDLRFDKNTRPGYFPAWLGQPIAHGKYVIVRKLGWGHYSSVWLARDRESDRFVSLKIMTCEATAALKSERSDEIGLLRKVASGERSHPGSRRVVEFYDTFDFDGPEGRHCCIVTEVLAFSVDFLRKAANDGDWRLPLPRVKGILKDVLLALNYLHNSCQIVHADIKPDNILFKPDDVESVVARDILVDPSETYECATNIRPPVVSVRSQVLSISTGDIDPRGKFADAVLADLGHSHWRDHHFQEEIQPFALRAPEVILGCGWDTPADIWSVGCLAMEFMIGCWLFEPTTNSTWSRLEDLLAYMTESLEEKFPTEMIKKGKHSNLYFNEDGTFAHFTAHPEPGWPLRRMLAEMSHFPDDQAEIEGAVRFVKRCLRLRPEDRATASDLASDPWLC